MNSSGAGTNMLTVLGADSKLVFVGPTEKQMESSFLSFFMQGILKTDPSPRC